MKIKQVTEVDITFDNGNRIYFDHEQDCCEHNYADFKQIDDLAWEWEFDISIHAPIVGCDCKNSKIPT